MARPTSVDYEHAVADAFRRRGEHLITDVRFYSAVVTGDLVTFAEKIAPEITTQQGVRLPLG